ncbi:ubiquitin carboxyl-terminal hydrolase, putative [Trypanosoma equiperdum]|uniref:Ubiquitin carboxyl-terminal hydrolase, putative n=2 Tax=Trypanozoon TaxID=39700 RepID=Q381Y9_TRYB2|nr:ubiquitin carboxyl-terminal hydrolase, putative [Trypanosoma brucei brucei TREU927]EAN80392.1 ubiquitin carboxyl-terminal hydrolase, putative [Trypanosoma brucei brucei TREU927]SCU69605.1 ubiquitin carboxyl-terminal hydrolase, putative [Trypanosoma equiperdum]
MASVLPSAPPGSAVISSKRRSRRGAQRLAGKQPDVKHIGVSQTVIDRLDLMSLHQELLETFSTFDVQGGMRRKGQRGSFASKFNHVPIAKGIVNRTNSCFMNAMLQAIIFTPPLAQLIISASDSELCPTLSALGKWMLSYWTKPANQSISPPQLSVAQSANEGVASTYLLLARMNGYAQEDALEFLQHLLDTINTELCSLEKHYCNRAAIDSGDEKGWTFVHGRERRSLREEKTGPHSILLDAVFGGTIQSHLKGKSRVRSHASVVLDRFFVLQVDVGFNAECTLEEALERTLQTEKVYDDSRAKDLVKTMKLHQLPLVLFAQLRRWAVTAEGELVKLDNIVRFGKTLVLPKSICSDETLSGTARTYQLVAFVAHRGSATGCGHYVTYIVNASLPENARSNSLVTGGEEVLTLCNDVRISHVTMREAIEGEAAYLLVYQRKT